jgi:hypothetical protein
LGLGRQLFATIRWALIFLPLFGLTFAQPPMPPAGWNHNLLQYLQDRIIVKFATGSITGLQKAALQSFAMPGEASRILVVLTLRKSNNFFPFVTALTKKCAPTKRTDLSTFIKSVWRTQPTS